MDNIVGGWCSLVLHQKLLHCKGSLTRYVVVVQDTIFDHFARFFPPHQMASCRHLENFSIKSGICCVLHCVAFGCILLFLDIAFHPLQSSSCDFDDF